MANEYRVIHCEELLMKYFVPVKYRHAIKKPEG